MAVEVKWLYPPNWDKTEQQVEGYRRAVIQIVEPEDDGNDLDELKVLDISTILTKAGLPTTRTVLEKYEYDVRGYAFVKVLWERNPRVVMLHLTGSQMGQHDYREVGGIVDPGEEGDGTGDLLVSTAGATSGDSFRITLYLKLKDSAPAPIQGA